MANVVHTTFYLLMFLAVLGHYGLVYAQIGSINIFNDADYDMSIQSTVKFNNGDSHTDPVSSPLSKGTSLQLQVMEGVDCIKTSFKMITPLGEYDQIITDWCSDEGSMPVLCVPTCFWTVDSTGFLVANPVSAQLQFIEGWNGPH